MKGRNRNKLKSIFVVSIIVVTILTLASIYSPTKLATLPSNYYDCSGDMTRCNAYWCWAGQRGVAVRMTYIATKPDMTNLECWLHQENSFTDGKFFPEHDGIWTGKAEWIGNSLFCTGLNTGTRPMDTCDLWVEWTYGEIIQPTEEPITTCEDYGYYSFPTEIGGYVLEEPPPSCIKRTVDSLECFECYSLEPEIPGEMESDVTFYIILIIIIIFIVAILYLLRK